MKQQLRTIRRTEASSGRAVSGWGFAILFALAVKPISARDLEARLGLSPSLREALVDELQEDYLVDVVSQLDGEQIRETLKLTEKGMSLLFWALEHTNELPESPSSRA